MGPHERAQEKKKRECMIGLKKKGGRAPHGKKKRVRPCTDA